MKKQKRIFNILFDSLGSSKFALYLIVFILTLLIISIIIPQASFFSTKYINDWEKSRPLFGAFARNLGLFDIYHSHVFLLITALLFINILICTIIRFNKLGGISTLRGANKTRMYGFLMVHLSLLLLFSGSFMSSAFQMTGLIQLTENQRFLDTEENYLYFSKGALREKKNMGILITQKKIDVDNQDGRYHLKTTSYLDILNKKNELTNAVVKINEPYVYENYHITNKKTGFSPFVHIYDNKSGREMAASYIALNTSRISGYYTHRDYFKFPFLEKKLFFTVYPDYKEENGNIIKVAEDPLNPIMLVQIENENGGIQKIGYVRLGEKIKIENYDLYFVDLKRWAQYIVMEDPGYIIVAISLWIGIVGLILRYFKELARWFNKQNE